MRLERSRSGSRAQGSRYSLKPKGRQLQAHDDMCDGPNEGVVTPHHPRAQQFPKGESSHYWRHHLQSRARTTHQFSDDFETNNDRRDQDRSKSSKSESGYDHRESPFSTRGTSEQSYDEPCRENSPESGYAYETDSRSKEYTREQYKQPRKDRLQRRWPTDGYDDGFSGRTGSKSHSSSGSGSSYSSSSDDEDFQLNANCMNALFSKDTERASNLIRCDKAGPSATEVQLKMTLPLPIQLMDGFDQLVPTKREFRSAMKSLKIQSDKIAKNCDFDYNRLDEQVIDEEFAGYAMPHFYKSLFEAPTEVSSEGDESLSREKALMNGASAFKNSKESAFLSIPGISKHLATSEQKYSNGGSSFRPGSLPSQVMIEENSSLVSSHDSLGMLSFGMKKQKKTVFLHGDSVGELQHNIEGLIDSSGIKSESSGEAAGKATVETSEEILNKMTTKEGAIHNLRRLQRSSHKSLERMQDNPSFDDVSPSCSMSDLMSSNASLGNPSDRKLLGREKNALSKFVSSSKMNLLVNNEGISARKLNLESVDNVNASFDAPDDEAPKASREHRKDVSTEQGNKTALSFVEGIPTSVDYGQKMTDKDIRTICSDLTLDEESFEKEEVQVVSFSNNRKNLAAGLTKPSRSTSTQNAMTCLLVKTRYTTESSEGDQQPFSGDEVLGPHGSLHYLEANRERAKLLDSAQSKVRYFTSVPSMETEEGPMDEISEKKRQEDPSRMFGISSVSLLKKFPEKVGTGDFSSMPQSEFTVAHASVLVTPVSQRSPTLLENQEHASYQTVPVSVPQIEGRLFPETTHACGDKGESPMDEERSVLSPAFTQVPLRPYSQVPEERRVPINYVQDANVEPCASSKQLGAEKGKLTCAEGSALKACKTLENFAAENQLEIKENGTADRTDDLSSGGFVNRLKHAAAARLEAMSATPIINSHLGSELKSFEESRSHESFQIDNPTNSTCNVGVPITAVAEECPVSDFQKFSRNDSSGDESVFFKKPSLNDDQMQKETLAVSIDTKTQIPIDEECDVFLDTADPDEYADESVAGPVELGSQEEEIRFISEIDARSQAVEINYVGGNRSVWTDSQSLITETQLVTAPTTTTIGTSLASAHTLFTTDTPVREPSSIFDPSDGNKARRCACPKVHSDLDFGGTDEFRDADQEYQFDERYARLAALLPATRLKTPQRSYPTPRNLMKGITMGLSSIILFSLSWLKHLLRLQKRKSFQSSRSTEGQPNFSRRTGTKHDSPPTTRQKIQGSRIFRSEIQHLVGEEGTGILVEFIVPDVHCRKGTFQHQPIWTVQGGPKLGHVEERKHAILCTSFSRKDSGTGWSAESAQAYYDFQEE